MIIGLMLAKRNSTRLENKNLLEFADGLSLFEFSLKEALKYPWYNEFMVFSDMEEVEDICKKYPEVICLKEPPLLAEQNNSWLPIKFLLSITGFDTNDILVYLPSTAPLRLSRDIKNALALYEIEKRRCHSVVGVHKCIKPPEWTFKKNAFGNLIIDKIKMTSQELTPYYHLNGAIYISCAGPLLMKDGYFNGKVKAFEMPYERSIDIDSKVDFELAQFYLQKRREKENENKKI